MRALVTVAAADFPACQHVVHGFFAAATARGNAVFELQCIERIMARFDRSAQLPIRNYFTDTDDHNAPSR